MESIEEKEQNDSTEGQDEPDMNPVTPLLQDPEKEITEGIISQDISQREGNPILEGMPEPKQPVYQHTKVYQDSDGRFVIEERIQDIHEEEKDISEEKNSPPEDGGTTKNKEQALRYLEAFASSVAEEMKKQAAQQDEAEASKQGEETDKAEMMIPDTSENAGGQVREMRKNAQMTESGNRRRNVTTVVFNKNERKVERKALAVTSAKNTAGIAMNTEEYSHDEVVTVVIADAAQEEKEGEETSTAEETKRQNLAASLSSLRRSKRKRRSKKRHYEDDDEDGGEDGNRKEGKSLDQAEGDDRGDGKVLKISDTDVSEKDKPSKVLKPKNKRLNQVYNCECGKFFPTNSQLRQHLRTHTTLKPHKCVFCGKCFRQKCQKDKHERIHTGSKPYKCRHCDRAFSESGSRNRHERIHTGYKPYKCCYCDKTFIQKGNKDAHEKIHTTFKPFKCDNENCNETFETEEEVKWHKEGHPQRPYKCHFCCKSFPFNAERKRHERCHTGVKPYKCGYCERSFTQKGNKDNHERTHTGEKPHSCQYCPKAFIRRQYLEKHQKKKHGKEATAVMNVDNTVYALVEVDPKLQKDGKIAAESLLTAAQIVASHATVENGRPKGGKEAMSSLQAQEIGQVMAQVTQQLSSVERHVAIVEHDGMQHQVQVVQHHQIQGELPQDGHITVVDGQIVEEHEVIGIQDQIVVTQQEVLDSVATDGHVIIQHHIPSEDIHMTIVEQPVPVTEENHVASEPQQIIHQDHCAEEGQEFGMEAPEEVVQEEFTGGKHTLVKSQGISEEEDQQKIGQKEFVSGNHILITSQPQLIVEESPHLIGPGQHVLVTASDNNVVDADHPVEEQLLIGEGQGGKESESTMVGQSQNTEEGEELVKGMKVEGQGEGLVIESQQEEEQIEGMETGLEGQSVEMS